MRKGAKINQLLSLGAAQPYYFHAGNWYHRLKRFPGVLIDKAGYVRFETEEQYRSTEGVDISTTSDNQVHVPQGISSLPGYQPFSEAELALIGEATIEPLEQVGAPKDEKTLRVKREIDAILRNQRHVREIKALYKNKCQICGERLHVRPGEYYSEVHHIKPLGKPHEGQDDKDNMICVCPNHHTLLDFFALRLDTSLLMLNKHSLNEEYVAYHNQRFEQLNPNAR